MSGGARSTIVTSEGLSPPEARYRYSRNSPVEPMRVATLQPRRSPGALSSFFPTMPKISVSEDNGARPRTLPVFHIAAEGKSPAEMKSPRPARKASVAVAPVVNTVISASSPSSLKKPFALATWNWTQCSSVPLKIRTLGSAADAGQLTIQLSTLANTPRAGSNPLLLVLAQKNAPYMSPSRPLDIDLVLHETLHRAIDGQLEASIDRRAEQAERHQSHEHDVSAQQHSRLHDKVPDAGLRSDHFRSHNAHEGKPQRHSHSSQDVGHG